jgi:hypothetical protein
VTTSAVLFAFQIILFSALNPAFIVLLTVQVGPECEGRGRMKVESEEEGEEEEWGMEKEERGIDGK